MAVLILLLLLMRVVLRIGGSPLISLFLHAFVLMPGWPRFLAQLPVSLFGLLAGWVLLIGLPPHHLVLFRMSGIFIGMCSGWCLMRLFVPLGMLHLGLMLMIFGLFGVEVLRMVYFVLTLWLEVLSLLAILRTLGGVPCVFVAGVLGVEPWGARALVGCIVFPRVMRLIVTVPSFLFILLYLLSYFFVDVSNLLLMFLRVFGIRGLVSLGGTLWFGIGVQFVVMVLVVPLFLFNPGRTGFPLICMAFINGVFDSLDELNRFSRQVVVSRRDEGIRRWKRWLREDLSSRPYAWLRPDFVPPSPFLVVKDPQTQSSHVVVVEPHLVDAEFRKAWMPYFCRSGHPQVSADQFLGFIGHFLPQEDFLELPRITGRDLQEVARAKRATAGGLDGWAWNEVKALPLPWFSGLAILLELVETTGTWPQGLLDAYIAMIPKADGDSTPLGQRPLSVLPVVYRLWASLRLGHLREWVEGWLPRSVYSLGNGLSSVEAWFSTALDIEDVLSGTGGDQLHVMVADVIKSFDTVDRSILDCALGRLGLPGWFRKVYFEFHSQVRLRFKLAAGLGEPWCRDGGIPQGCPLSMVFIVALHVPWCRHLESLPDLKPQLYADNLKCSTTQPRALFKSAYFTAKYVRLVGQDVSPGKCVLLSTSKDCASCYEALGYLG